MNSCNRILVGHFGMSNTVGGAETFILGLAEHIDQDKFQLEVITPFLDHVLHDRLSAAIDEEAIHVVPPVSNPLEYRRGVGRLLAERSYDIVHVHRNSAANIIPIMCAAHTKKRPAIVVHAHNTSSGAGMVGQMLHKINQKRLIANADSRLACSKMAGEFLFGSNTYTVVPNGIDVERFRYNEETRQRMRSELGIADDELLIGNVARSVPEKNQSFLIDIVSRPEMRLTKCKLIIVGDGPCLPDLMARTVEKDISERIIFTGARADVCDIMQAMDVFALPSLFEGLPIVLIEAQAAGLPCLVSKNVSEEANITGLISYEQINDIDAWQSKLQNIDHTTDIRMNYSEYVKCSGYGISGLVSVIERSYDEARRVCRNKMRLRA